MLKYLIQVVQNSLAAAVLLAVLSALARFHYGQEQKKILYWGFLSGVASALILSILKSTTTLINREYFNIGILSAAVLTEILFFALIWKAAEWRDKIRRATYSILTALLLLYCLPDIFLYPTGFLITGESIFGTDFLFKAIGYLGGLLIAGLSGLALYKVGISLSLELARVLLTVGLAINMLKQIAAIVQFLLARRIIPMTKWIFEFVKISVNYGDFFLYSIMAVTLLTPVMLWIKSLHPSEAFDNPAQHRKIRAAARRRKRWCAVILAGYILTVLCLTVVKAYDNRAVVLSPAEPMNIVGDEIVLPLETIGDGHLHRFVHTASNGVEVRFIVIQKNANAYGVGLDACDICGPTGYYERGGKEVICKLCDVVMNISTIGFKGGCNPVPLAYTLSGGNMIIQIQSLENEKKRFE